MPDKTNGKFRVQACLAMQKRGSWMPTKQSRSRRLHHANDAQDADESD